MGGSQSSPQDDSITSSLTLEEYLSNAEVFQCLISSNPLSSSDARWLGLLDPHLVTMQSVPREEVDRVVLNHFTYPLLEANETSGNLPALLRFFCKTLNAVRTCALEALPCHPTVLRCLSEFVRIVLRQMIGFLTAPDILYHCEHSVYAAAAAHSVGTSAVESNDRLESMPSGSIKLRYRYSSILVNAYGVRLSAIRKSIADWFSREFPEDLWIITHCGFVYYDSEVGILSHSQLAGRLRSASFKRHLVLVPLWLPTPIPSAATAPTKHHHPQNDATKNELSDSDLRQSSVLRELFLEVCEFVTTNTFEEYGQHSAHLITTQHVLLEMLIGLWSVLLPDSYPAPSLFLASPPSPPSEVDGSDPKCVGGISNGTNMTPQTAITVPPPNTTEPKSQQRKQLYSPSLSPAVHSDGMVIDPVGEPTDSSGKEAYHGNYYLFPRSPYPSFPQPPITSREAHGAPFFYFYLQTLQPLDNVFSPTVDYLAGHHCPPTSLFLELFIETISYKEFIHFQQCLSPRSPNLYAPYAKQIGISPPVSFLDTDTANTGDAGPDCQQAANTSDNNAPAVSIPLHTDSDVQKRSSDPDDVLNGGDPRAVQETEESQLEGQRAAAENRTLTDLHRIRCPQDVYANLGPEDFPAPVSAELLSALLTNIAHNTSRGSKEEIRLAQTLGDLDMLNNDTSDRPTQNCGLALACLSVVILLVNHTPRSFPSETDLLQDPEFASATPPSAAVDLSVIYGRRTSMHPPCDYKNTSSEVADKEARPNNSSTATIDSVGRTHRRPADKNPNAKSDPQLVSVFPAAFSSLFDSRYFSRPLPPHPYPVSDPPIPANKYRPATIPPNTNTTTSSMDGQRMAASDTEKENHQFHNIVFRRPLCCFDKLFNLFCSDHADEHLFPLLLYSLISQNKAFRLFCLTHSELYRLINSTLQILHRVPDMCTFIPRNSPTDTAATTGIDTAKNTATTTKNKSRQQNNYEQKSHPGRAWITKEGVLKSDDTDEANSTKQLPHVNDPSLGYPAPPAGTLILVVFLILSEDSEFNRTLSATRLKPSEIRWLKNDRLTESNDTPNLATVCLTVAMKILSWNFEHSKDSFFEGLCLSFLGNISPYIANIQWTTAEKLVAYCFRLGRLIYVRVSSISRQVLTKRHQQLLTARTLLRNDGEPADGSQYRDLTHIRLNSAVDSFVSVLRGFLTLIGQALQPSRVRYNQTLLNAVLRQCGDEGSFQLRSLVECLRVQNVLATHLLSVVGGMDTDADYPCNSTKKDKIEEDTVCRVTATKPSMANTTSNPKVENEEVRQQAFQPPIEILTRPTKPQYQQLDTPYDPNDTSTVSNSPENLTSYAPDHQADVIGDQQKPHDDTTEGRHDRNHNTNQSWPCDYHLWKRQFLPDEADIRELAGLHSKLVPLTRFIYSLYQYCVEGLPDNQDEESEDVDVTSVVQHRISVWLRHLPSPQHQWQPKWHGRDEQPSQWDGTSWISRRDIREDLTFQMENLNSALAMIQSDLSMRYWYRETAVSSHYFIPLIWKTIFLLQPDLTCWVKTPTAAAAVPTYES